MAIFSKSSLLVSKGTSITDQQLKKWRYSVPLTTYPKDVLQAERVRNLGLIENPAIRDRPQA